MKNYVNIIGSIFGILQIIGLIMAIIEKKWIIVIVSVVNILIILLVLFFAYILYSEDYKSKIYRYFKYKFACDSSTNIILYERSSVYEFISRTEMKHKKEFMVFCKKASCDCFTDRYVWTKRTPEKLEVIADDNNQEIVDEKKYKGWNFYTIKSKIPVQRNHQMKFSMKINKLDDPSKESYTILTSGIYEPTKRLELKVILSDKGLRPKNMKLKIFSDYVDAEPIEVSEEMVDYDAASGTISVVIEYPILYYRYILEWEFVD